MGPAATRLKRQPVALVTGAGVRVGLAIARDLSRHGYAVAAHYRSHRPPRPLVPLKGDLANPREVEGVARAFRERFDRLDLLVCSAAGFEPRALRDTDAASFDAQMDVNARAPLLLARALLPVLRRTPGSSIVNVADVGGALVPWAGYAAYAASKAALARLTECLALELAPRVRVNAVAPGTVLWPEHDSPARRRALTQRIPLHRTGTPRDVCDAVRYLATAEFVTGVILPIDGGRRLNGRVG